MGQDGNDPGQNPEQDSGSDRFKFGSFHTVKKALVGGGVGALIGGAALTAFAAVAAVVGVAALPIVGPALAGMGLAGGLGTAGGLATVASTLAPIALAGAALGGGIGAAVNGGLGAMHAGEEYDNDKEREKVRAQNALVVEQRTKLLQQTYAVKQAQLKKQAAALGVETNPNAALPNLAEGPSASIG